MGVFEKSGAIAYLDLQKFLLYTAQLISGAMAPKVAATPLKSLDSAEDASYNLRALEAAASQLFSVEGGQVPVPGLKKETHDESALSERSQLLTRLGFVLTDGQAFIGPAKVVDLPALAQCRLGVSIQAKCSLSAMRVGRLLLYLAAIFSLMGAA